MMKQISKYLLVSAALAILGQMPVFGFVGEPAPALNVREWIKGGPVEINPGTNIYVVEFFQTKFAGCRVALTNLVETQNHFKDSNVVVVAVSDEGAGIVREYFGGKFTNANYAVAADNGRHTALAYMKPLNRSGLPYSFIVGTNGNVLWHGMPVPGLNIMLQNVLTGNYKEDQAAKLDLTRHQLEQYIGLARQGSDRTKMAGKTLLASRTNDLPLLCELAFDICTVPGLKVRDFALADEALKQAEEMNPTNTAGIGMGRAVWLFESGKREDGLAKAREVFAEYKNSQDSTNLQTLVNLMEARYKGIQNRQSRTNLDEAQFPAPNGAGGATSAGGNP